MKKLIFIVLLIVGCDNNSTESSVHPLVGVWETTEVTFTEGNDSSIEIMDENISITFIFGEDETLTFTSIIEGETETDSGTWSATGNKLTVVMDGKTTVCDYSISGNILTLTFEETEDGVTTISEFKCEKQ